MNFNSMFHAIHGYNPFPWQSNAAKLLLQNATSLTIKVPTASGKTAMIDAALFSAAQGGPRKIVFIIDRRVVVDETYNRAKQIVEALRLKKVPELSVKFDDIQIVRLRGGVFGDDDWVLYPDKVTIIISTVDQVGSRLLHRGYGVSPRMAPIHAGFLGSDSFFIIDEAHLSYPFIQTVQACRRHGAEIRLVKMTATPTVEEDTIVDLSENDRSHPVLGRRIKASKRVQIQETLRTEKKFVAAVIDAAEDISKSARIVGIIVNRVATARKIWTDLKKKKHRVELLTGRIRPYDRDQLINRVFPAIRAGRDRSEDMPHFFVATQTVEVGADIDFDGLVTEAAPLDSLRQRFGRLDRLGELQNSEGVIIYRKPQVDNEGVPKPDPIYGMAIHETWQWLLKVSNANIVDFGIVAMEELMRHSKPPGTITRNAPVLLPAHIDLLSQTGPEAPLIDVSAWLHGTGAGSPDIAIAWRADLLTEKLESWKEVALLRPPLTGETLEIPLYAARSWLEGKRQQDVFDLEGVPFEITSSKKNGLPLLRWRGQYDVKITYANDIRPGDTIIVPAAYGGHDMYGWAPNSKQQVTDVADLCSCERRRNHVVRLVPGLMDWLGEMESTVHEAVIELVESETQIDPEYGIDEARVQSAHDSLRRLLKNVDHELLSPFQSRIEIERHPMGVILRGNAIDEIKGSRVEGGAVPLDKHLNGVAEIACMLSEGYKEQKKIVTAAKNHDLGKQEHRFQTMLYGDPFSAAAGPPIAKSTARKFADKLAAYAKSGLPRGFRHELASLELTADNDLLVRYLIGVHHGYGRPWFPKCQDTDAIGAYWANLGSGWSCIFSFAKNIRGPWYIAGIELLLRAADARQSIAERE